ncbi:MAG TPA: hypothetical protein PLD96_01235 [Methanothrix sp.]|nr:hypothetical protein [Methanothrix sp.]
MGDTPGCSCPRWPRSGASILWSSFPGSGVKASLPQDAWLDEDAMVEHFQAQIFAEVAPGREVFEKSFLEGSEGTCGT